ncbi:helicase HerA-like domain-containing protein [Terrarubrum flagellatum]|uniref:helicase HerA-like domain-containing protein n=1 Tax=Terrirubrum flagellatum TaxID=2895980 RepID=UPI003144F512
MTSIIIGKTAAGAAIEMPLRLANRHGLVTGSTGGGKTVTLQTMAEGFSRAGVPVFAADIKGDLSGLAQIGEEAGRFADAAKAAGFDRTPQRFPVRFWDLFGRDGLPIRTSVEDMGPLLLSRLLGLNDAQEGTLVIAMKHATDRGFRLLDLEDLSAALRDIQDDAEDVRDRYGNFTGASVGVIQRQMLVLMGQGGDALFGEPAINIKDLLSVDDIGRGVINLLSAERLIETPRLYGAFLLYLLTKLFEVLPEVGDLEKPKLVFFFDEAHMLFREASPRLMETIERVVRLIRSKGVGVYFVSQSPLDAPPAVLAQLGNRVQHALRAFTPQTQRLVKAVAQTFRSTDAKALPDVIMGLGIGEALVSLIQSDGSPAVAQVARIAPPAAQVGPIGPDERHLIMRADALKPRYGEKLSRLEQKARFLTKGMSPHEVAALSGAAERTAEIVARESAWLRSELMPVEWEEPEIPAPVTYVEPRSARWALMGLCFAIIGAIVIVGAIAT